MKTNRNLKWKPRANKQGLMNSQTRVHIPKHLKIKGHRKDWKNDLNY